MTETEYLAESRPNEMLAWLDGRAGARKFRLFACACCRRHWGLFTDPGTRTAVEVLERFADGAASDAELAEARRGARAAGVRLRAEWNAARDAQRAQEQRAWPPAPGWWELEQAVKARAEQEGAAWLVWELLGRRKWGPAEAAAAAAAFGVEVAQERGTETAERTAQCALVREVFGNPFRPVRVDPAWLAWHGGAVGKLAGSIYAGRRFADLPILADALEEAGCDNPEVLSHCRDGGEHVLGCWVLDGLLDRV